MGVFSTLDGAVETINQTVTWISTNPWIVFLSFVLAFLGILLAIYFYVKSRRIKSLMFAIRNYNLIRGFVSKIQLLEMRYSGERIENVSISKIALWNGGNDVIDSQNIASLNPLTISVSAPYKILDRNIIYAKNKSNKFDTY